MAAWLRTLENMVIDTNFWCNQRIFLTGHTGFKGSWLSLLLSSLGAQVFGYALPPENDNDIFNVAKVATSINHQIGDIRNLSDLISAVQKVQPTIVLHMASQALVRKSYDFPIETYLTNVMGTAHLLEAVRQVGGAKAVIIITSDKCYENMEWSWGYRETDRLGGYDPYSNSKACAELVTSAYQKSFFEGESKTLIASARAGNVIGGGDWSSDRLVPDAMRAFSKGKKIQVRFPNAIRPWQHVLDPLLGYLKLAERLSTGSKIYEGGWNFGPAAASEISVQNLLNLLVKKWGQNSSWESDGLLHPYEANYLKLDCSKSQMVLKWHPRIDLENSINLTIDWYKAYQNGQDMRKVTSNQIDQVLN